MIKMVLTAATRELACIERVFNNVRGFTFSFPTFFALFCLLFRCPSLLMPRTFITTATRELAWIEKRAKSLVLNNIRNNIKCNFHFPPFIYCFLIKTHHSLITTAAREVPASKIGQWVFNLLLFLWRKVGAVELDQMAFSEEGTKLVESDPGARTFPWCAGVENLICFEGHNFQKRVALAVIWMIHWVRAS